MTNGRTAHTGSPMYLRACGTDYDAVIDDLDAMVAQFA
jgi:hypothetical protein